MAIENKDSDAFEHLRVKRFDISLKDFGRSVAVGWLWATLKRGLPDHGIIVLTRAQADELKDKLEEIIRY